MSTANFPKPSQWGVFPALASASASGAPPVVDQSVADRSVRWTMFAVSFIALLASSYLAWASLTSSPVAGCGGGSVFDCSHVLHSRWSTVLSLPVSVPALATHALILGMLLWQPLSARLRRLRWSLIGLGSLAAGAAALWFISVQVFWLRQLCPYCLVAHAAGIILAAVFLLSRARREVPLGWIGGAAAASLACLIGLQTLNEVPPSYHVIEYPQAPATQSAPQSTTDAPFAAPQAVQDEPHLFEAPDSASTSVGNRHSAIASPSGLGDQAAGLLAAWFHPSLLVQGQVGAGASHQHTARILSNVTLDTSQWPLIGKPDAELVFVELFDYTCEHCQKTHRSLEAARQQFGDRLAVLTLPVPLDRKCNPTVQQTHASHRESCELAKLAVALWKTDREKFAEFHDYLFAATPRYSQALAHAQTLVDEQQLGEILRSRLPADYIAKHVSLYQRAGAGQIPKLMFPRATSVGAVESPASMINLINRHLP